MNITHEKTMKKETLDRAKDDSSKLRGARRDILYINECNNVTFDAYNELAIRTRKEVYLDFNPAKFIGAEKYYNETFKSE